jgi:hypothetical protein
VPELRERVLILGKASSLFYYVGAACFLVYRFRFVSVYEKIEWTGSLSTLFSEQIGQVTHARSIQQKQSVFISQSELLQL